VKKLTGQRLELLIFTLVTLFNLYPFVALRFFPTLDGASHMSNANLINQIVLYHNDLIRQFFIINPEPIPNWTTHLILSLGGLFLPAFLAEKILIIILLTGTPFAFRSLIRTIAPGNPLFAYFIFPFTQSMFFYLGFYNFCIGVLFLLISLTFWLRNYQQMNHPRNLARLAALILITWFSHILLFGVLLLVIGIHLLATLVHQTLTHRSYAKTALHTFFSGIGHLLLASAVPLLLFIYFFLSRPETRDVIFLPPAELTRNLLQMKPLIVFNAITEGALVSHLMLTVVGLFTVGAVLLLKSFFSRKKTTGLPDAHGSNKTNAAWLLTSMLSLTALYFILPDAMGNASFTTCRLIFLAFLMAILWLSTFPIPKWIVLIAAIIVLYINFSLLNLKRTKLEELEKIAIACNKAADYVTPNSIVLPMFCMDNWFVGHFVDYIAIDKPMVMLYNYECETGYFPVKNNISKRPNYFLGNPAIHHRLIRFERNQERPFKKIDYVFIVGGCSSGNTDNWEKIERILALDFMVAYKSDYCTLFIKR
jgi:hypothetical protein